MGIALGMNLDVRRLACGGGRLGIHRQAREVLPRKRRLEASLKELDAS